MFNKSLASTVSIRTTSRLLLDQNIPRPLLDHLPNHQAAHAFDLGWGELTNGDLIAKAELAGYDVLITADQSLRYQQNLAARRIGLVVFSTNGWPIIRGSLATILTGIDQAGPGRYVELDLPRPPLLRRPPPAQA